MLGITDVRESPNFLSYNDNAYNRIKVGNQYLSDDVTRLIDAMSGTNRSFTKQKVQQALAQDNIQSLRQISNYFFKTSGIYKRLCLYMANLFRYDWFIVPQRFNNIVKDAVVIENWYKASRLLEAFNLKQTFGDISLKVVRDGVYYGYRMQTKDNINIQELPPAYCRSRYKVNGSYAVEFNIKYFDEQFKDNDYRLRVLKMFPKEFQKAYIAYKKGTLKQDFNGDDRGWFLLNPDNAVKFNNCGLDSPMFVAIIPAILDLQAAQDLDRNRMEQQLMRLVIQKFPLDKQSQLIFDIPEMQTLHSNVVGMLKDVIGVNVLSSVADVSVADMSDKGNVSTVDQLEKVERTVYNEAGVSQMQFNTEGNIALEKSIVNDESSMMNLVYQFERFGQKLLQPFNTKPKKLLYTFHILPTTGYNYKELSQLYKEQTMLGYSKLLPQVALGQPQSSIIAAVVFENDFLHLNEVFEPPSMSSTTSASDDEGGRPEKPDDEKDDKTIQNKEGANSG